MQPASSSSEDDDDESSIEQSINSKNHIATTSNKEHNPVSFDELPSEDSCLEDSDDDDDSDSDDESGGGGGGGSSSSSVPSDDDSESNATEDSNREVADGSEYGHHVEAVEEEISLAHRLDSKRNRGVVRNTDAGMVKSEALALARRRLQELKEKKKKKVKQQEIRKNADEASTSFFLTDENEGSDDDNEEGDNDKQQIDDEAPTERPKKKSKHAPTIASSLRSDYFQRGAPNLNASGVGVEVGANRYKPRDPRMEASSLTSATGGNGVVDTDVFDRRYEFLEAIQDKEIDSLKERCKAWKLKGKKGTSKRRKLGLTFGEKTAEDDTEELERLMRERAERRESRLKKTARRSVNKKMKDEVASGKRGAYYLKKRDRKRMEMEAKFEELKKSGGNDALNKVLAKKRKKKRSKDASLMPRDMPFSR